MIKKTESSARNIFESDN